MYIFYITQLKRFMDKVLHWGETRVPEYRVGGKFLKKLWCCVGGRVQQGNLVLSTVLITLIGHRKEF